MYRKHVLDASILKCSKTLASKFLPTPSDWALTVYGRKAARVFYYAMIILTNQSHSAILNLDILTIDITMNDRGKLWDELTESGHS